MAPEVYQRLRDLRREGETDSDVIQRLLDGTPQGTDSGLGVLPEENLTRLGVVLDVLGESLTVENVAGIAIRMWGKLGAVISFKEGTERALTTSDCRFI